jgi:D-serine deaminase-like pyridoxal phosphate-dependent protein
MVTAIGRSKWELDTPALCVELPVMERNIRRMADVIICQHGLGWRPHTKGQKVPALAHMELDAGAFGVTCAKLGEAEVMAAAGIRDILVANQVVGAEKVARLVNLRRHADVMVAIDSLENAREIDAAARAKGVCVRVVIELDIGMRRAGVQPGDPAVALALQLAALDGLKFTGVMGWEGHSAGIADQEEKRLAVETAVGQLVATACRCREAGLAVDVVSCGGTGTYWISATVPGVTEIQAGGGIFHDVLYAEHFGVAHEHALTLLSTVTSRPTPERIICDAGRKTMSAEAASPRPMVAGPVARVRLSAEHGVIDLAAPCAEPRVGDKVEWIVGYSDTTTFLHEELYATRDGIVEQIWPVLGRGKLR